MIIDQQVYMIVFPIELNQLCFKVVADPGKYRLQLIENGFGKNITSIFRHKNKTSMKIKKAVSSSAYIYFLFQGPIVLPRLC